MSARESGGDTTGAIADRLRGLIVRGVLSPGEHLGQSQLATRFGRSKVPVREAMKQLAAEGMLRHDPNRGYFVSGLSLADARQLYGLRRWLEAQLLETARWPDEVTLADLRHRFAELDAIDMRADGIRWAETLMALRHAIFDLSPSKLLLREALRLWSLTDRYRALLPRETGGSAERALLDAFAARDHQRLLATYHADRDRIEALLFAALEERAHA